MSDQATALGPKFFVLGTYVQSAGMMDTWQARGINTVVQVPDGNNVLQWAQAADAKGLYQIRQPSSDLHFDINDPHLLAWATQDEPSNTTSTLDYGVVSQDPAEVQQQAASWRAAAQAEGKYVPVWTNHVSGHIFPDWAQNNALMHDYMQGSESDWLSADGYPIQEHQAFVLQSNDGYTSTAQGITLDRQIAWSGGKPAMAFIGTSAYNDGNALPSTGEFNAMAWSSIIHGAVGITYFPVDLSPWSFDATPANLVQAMTAFDQEIASIDKILMNETTGGRDPYTVFRSANPGTAPKADQLPYPFEASEIQTEQGVFRIILNLSNQDQVLNKPEWGINNVTFHGYEVHKGYADSTITVPPPGDPVGTNPVPTPTPSNLVVSDPAPTTGLVLHVAGDQHQGAPQFNVSVDGKVVATGLSAPGNHGANGWTDVTVDGDFSHASQIAVTFTNDLWSGSLSADRNLYVDYLEVNGRRLQAEAGQTTGDVVLQPNDAFLRSSGDTITFAATDFVL